VHMSSYQYWYTHTETDLTVYRRRRQEASLPWHDLDIIPSVADAVARRRRVVFHRIRKASELAS
jgi:hypothetical protein